jgi:hypothetical protein
MVAVMAGEVFLIVAGGIYCSVLDACGRYTTCVERKNAAAALEQRGSQPDLRRTAGIA